MQSETLRIMKDNTIILGYSSGGAMAVSLCVRLGMPFKSCLLVCPSLDMSLKYGEVYQEGEWFDREKADVYTGQYILSIARYACMQT